MKWWGPCVIQLLRLLSDVILSLFIFRLGVIPGHIPGFLHTLLFLCSTISFQITSRKCFICYSYN